MHERISDGGGDAGAVPLGSGGDAGEDEQKNEKKN
jgi:hypothetical protein